MLKLADDLTSQVSAWQQDAVAAAHDGSCPDKSSRLQWCLGEATTALAAV